MSANFINFSCSHEPQIVGIVLTTIRLMVSNSLDIFDGNRDAVRLYREWIEARAWKSLGFSPPLHFRCIPRECHFLENRKEESEQTPRSCAHIVYSTRLAPFPRVYPCRDSNALSSVEDTSMLSIALRNEEKSLMLDLQFFTKVTSFSTFREFQEILNLLRYHVNFL